MTVVAVATLTIIFTRPATMMTAVAVITLTAILTRLSNEDCNNGKVDDVADLIWHL